MEDIYDKWVMQLREGSYEAFSRIVYALLKQVILASYWRRQRMFHFQKISIQETFMKLWNMREQLDCYGNVNALIFTIARNLIIDSFRKQVAQLDFEDYRQACDKVSSFATPEEQLDYHESVDRIRQVKKLLSKRACQIYEMSREKNMPIQEIAESLNLSSQTVKNYLTSTLKIFRRELSR